MNAIRPRLSAALIAAAALCAAGCESPPPNASGETTPAPVGGVYGGAPVTAKATVTAVDQATRQVTIRRADGATATIRCGENVRNLPQVKVGDEVSVTYYESLAFEVRKPGEGTPGATYVGAAGRAPEGEKPGAAAGQALQITATIVAIDKENMRVTLRGPDGANVVFKARDAEKLARVAVGDLVEITYSEALAVEVTPPAR